MSRGIESNALLNDNIQNQHRLSTILAKNFRISSGLKSELRTSDTDSQFSMIYKLSTHATRVNFI